MSLIRAVDRSDLVGKLNIVGECGHVVRFRSQLDVAVDVSDKAVLLIDLRTKAFAIGMDEFGPIALGIP